MLFKFKRNSIVQIPCGKIGKITSRHKNGFNAGCSMAPSKIMNQNWYAVDYGSSQGIFPEQDLKLPIN